jgi:hypothetical protein
MPKYIIKTQSTCISQFTIEAKNADEAEEILYAVEHEDEEYLDFKDEFVISVTEEK